MTEQNLIKNLKKGQEEAFSQLLDTYGDKILQTAFFYLKNREQAQDICQEVLLTVFKEIKKFKGESSLYTWLYRITVNKCYDYSKLKKNQYEKFIDIDDIKEKDLNQSTDEQVLNKIQQENIRKAIQKLEFTYREAIFFFYYQQLKIEEIAEILNCQSGTIKSRLSRGRERLREILVEEVL
ncbi:MAG: RNA polymerase sigma factor [Bacillota bacterium]